MEYFLAVVDHGGVTRAAKALHIAQPSLSQSIKSLERELGTQLFRRVGRGLELTPAGESLVGPARQLLHHVSGAQAAARRVARLESGRLDIVALPTLAVDPLAQLAGEFARRYPGVALNVLVPGDMAAAADLTRTGECELGLTMLPVNHPELICRELGAQRIDVVLPPQADAGGRGPLPVAALADLAWVTSPPGSSTRILLEEALAGTGAVPNVAVETDNRESIVPLVLAGAGATLLPRPLAREAARRGAKTRPTDPPIIRHIGIVHRDGTLSAPARAFLDLAAALSPGRSQ